MPDNLTGSFGLEFSQELAIRMAMITLRMGWLEQGRAKGILNRYPDERFDGKRQQVALAQVLINEPRPVIFGETSGTMCQHTKTIPERIELVGVHAQQTVTNTSPFFDNPYLQ